jgi:hypothetical protein
MGEEADVTPSLYMPELAIAIQPLPDDGPVLIQIEYQIDPENRDPFLRAIQAVEATRRRNGAARWRVYRDLGAEGRFIERYVITSWSEYVRLRSPHDDHRPQGPRPRDRAAAEGRSHPRLAPARRQRARISRIGAAPRSTSETPTADP